MADSDEEYDRRRRDKFRRERSDYQERRDDRSRRDEWTERDRGSRREYRDYDPRSRRDRYSPLRHDVSPPMKRIRRDWDDRGGFPGYDINYPPGSGNMMGGPPHGGWGSGMPQDMGMMHSQHGYGSHQGPQRDMEQGITQPPMMTFKQFLGSQDDAIDDQEAVKKYNEYKLEFKRQQINEFFLNHKEEEWFKSKYHPEECGKRRADQVAALKKRLDVFLELLDKDAIDAVSIDVEKSDQIVHLLDAVVIKLEGGTDNDLRVLDEPYEEEKPKEMETLPLIKKDDKKSNKEDEEDEDETEEKPIVKEPEEKIEPRRKRSRDYSYDENDDSSADSESELEPAAAAEEECESVVLGDDASDVKKRKKKKKHKEDSRTEQEGSIEKDDDDAPVEEKQENEDTNMKKKENNIFEEKDNKNIETTEQDKEVIAEDSVQKPRPLHKTCSIFLRNLAPSITKQEVEAMCKRYSGFLRVAIADPQPERRFFRRGWVTFERTVNIKEICWNLNNIRLRDYELGAIVNRDLSRRIRSVNGIASHKQVVRSDIKLAARIIQNMDEQRNLWTDTETKEMHDQNFGLVSKNPLLKNITDYLIEEANAEEEELLGMSEQEENRDGEESGCTLEKDETLIKVLDRLLFYLRIVHSIDYYNHSEYPNEDEMPNRCGIIHARGSPPSSKVTQQEINDYVSHFEGKILPFLQPQVKLSEEEAVKLGKKDSAIEVEKFVQANTQELAKDKWLCPLSGKKFKGPEFVRKHIFNKHSEKVEEVKKEVEYFNNYLLDPKRPQLPEHPSNRSMGPGSNIGRDIHPMMGPYHGGAGGYPPMPPPYGSNYRGPGGPGFQGYGNPGFGGRNSFESYSRSGYSKRNSYGRCPDPREVIAYHDLDNPQDVEIF
ncbi:serrate RNA effector molecule homolog isoform X2 [Centruroides vittatus]|uniref:serrate RNA effector molecule homolog isoform X2 n=1 Tax=Centruroides vittatus TaxID=120091 RepID=UPI00350EE14D